MKKVFLPQPSLRKTAAIITVLLLIISLAMGLSACNFLSHLTKVEGEVGKLSPRDLTHEEQEIFNAMGAKGASSSIHMTEGYLDIVFQTKEILPDGGKGEIKNLEMQYKQVEHSLDDGIVYFIQDTDEKKLTLSMGVSGEGLLRCNNIEGFVTDKDSWDDIDIEPIETVLEAKKSSRVAKVTLKKDGKITRQFYILMKPVKPREWA